MKDGRRWRTLLVLLAVAAGCRELVGTADVPVTLVARTDSLAVPRTVYDGQILDVAINIASADGALLGASGVRWSSSEDTVITVAQGRRCDGTAITTPDASSHACLRAMNPGAATITVRLDQPGLAAETTFAIHVNQKWIDVATMQWATCGLNARRDVFCWGFGDLVGTGASNDVKVPTPLFNPQHLKFGKLYAGPQTACGAVYQVTVVACWGFNWYGAAGMGQTALTSVLPVLLTGDVLRKVALGYRFSCGIAGTADSRVTCWGLDSAGFLGRDSAAFGVPCSISTPNSNGRRCVYQVGYEEPFYPSRPVASDVAVGLIHGCAITQLVVWCWGDNSSGELGIGTVAPAKGVQLALVPERVDAFSSIAASGFHTCLRVGPDQVDGSVYCWGENGNGESGALGFQASCPFLTFAVCTSPTPQLISRKFAQVAAGDQFSCGLVVAGNAYCWGSNILGQLGTGEEVTIRSRSAVPVLVKLDSGRTFTKIAAASGHACGIAAGDGALFCWGYDLDGQLGDGVLEVSRPAPVRVVEPGTIPTSPARVPLPSRALAIPPHLRH